MPTPIRNPRRVTAVIFDLDGVLLDSEPVWAATRRYVADALGGQWWPEAERAMKGMNAPEWSAYMQRELAIPRSSDEIVEAVLERMSARYREDLPLLDGAAGAVDRLGVKWQLGLASSSNRVLIDLVLDLTGWASRFAVTVSSEEVARGKPAPDVYLEAARRLNTGPGACVAIEDSASGVRSAAAARMRVVAVPRPDAPVGLDELRLAATVLASPAQLADEVVAPLLSDKALGRPLERTATATRASVALSPASSLNFGPQPGPGDSDGG
jgi:HAD superfamily hydrolase (TIGR01509 family)